MECIRVASVGKFVLFIRPGSMRRIYATLRTGGILMLTTATCHAPGNLPVEGHHCRVLSCGRRHRTIEMACQGSKASRR